MILNIKDDFLTKEELKKTREEILKSDFAGVDYEGHFYKGITVPEAPLFNAKEKLERMWNRKVTPKIEFFRLSKPQEESPSYVHADTICAKMASVLYLTDSDVGGTAFWKHKETGLQRLSPNPSEKLIEKLLKDANDVEKWDMQAELKFKMNRFVTYPTNYFHSRWPFLSEGFGEDKESARLIYVCFYDFD